MQGTGGTFISQLFQDFDHGYWFGHEDRKLSPLCRREARERGKSARGTMGRGKRRLLLSLVYRKFPKKSPGTYIFRRPFLRGLFLEGLIFGGAYIREGNLRFKIDWASLIVGGKFTVFALFYFVNVFEGNFKGQAPGGLIFGGGIERFLRCRFGRLVHGGAYFRNFTVFRGDRTAVQCMKTETNCPLKGSL